MKIEEVSIRGLWGQYNLDWRLNSHVTILSGINGSGKSTILRAMASLLCGEPIPDVLAPRLSEIRIRFKSGETLKQEVHMENLDELSERARNDARLSKIVDDLQAKYKDQLEDGRARLISSQKIAFSKGDSNTSTGIKDFIDGLRVSYISTFDSAPPKPENPAKLMEYIVNSSYSELDRHLENVVNRYKNYQIELSTQMSKMMAQSDSESAFSDVKKLFDDRLALQDTIDDLLKESGKRLNRDKGEIEFILKADNESHSYKSLSAGEKQMLLILLTVFMQEGKDAILIMDEPEISLHVDWQRRLLDVITKMNPNCQVIVSTHSPAMILNGWQSAVDNISDLASQF